MHDQCVFLKDVPHFFAHVPRHRLQRLVTAIVAPRGDHGAQKRLAFHASREEGTLLGKVHLEVRDVVEGPAAAPQSSRV